MDSERESIDSSHPHINEDALNITWKSSFSFMRREDLPLLTASVISAAIAGATKPAIAIFLGRIFNILSSYALGEITQSQLLHNISIWSLALTALGCAVWSFNSLFFSLWLLFGESQARTLRAKLFTGLLAKDMAWYELRVDGVSSLLVRIQTCVHMPSLQVQIVLTSLIRQVRELQMANSQVMGFFIEELAASIVAIVIALVSSWKLSLVTLAMVPLVVVFTSLATHDVQPAIKEQKLHLSNASKLAFNALRAVDTVKCYTAQDHEIWQFRDSVRAAATAYYRQARGSAAQMGITRTMTILMFFAAFWYGQILVKEGLSPGTILTTFYAILTGVQAAEALLPQYLVLVKGMAAGETLKFIMNQMENGRVVQKMHGGIKPTKCAGDIELENVSIPSYSFYNNLSVADIFRIPFRARNTGTTRRELFLPGR